MANKIMGDVGSRRKLGIYSCGRYWMQNFRGNTKWVIAQYSVGVTECVRVEDLNERASST